MEQSERPGHVRTRLLTVKSVPNLVIHRNIQPLLKTIQSAYNERQSLYPEDRNEIAFPVRIYGYHVIGAHTGFRSYGDRRCRITLSFSVKPMPYAFNGGDGGVNDTACRAVTFDLRDLIFRFPIHALPKDLPEAAKMLIERWVTEDQAYPIDASTYDAEVSVFLSRSKAFPTKARCTLALDADPG